MYTYSGTPKNCKTQNLGYFHDEEDAARAVDQARLACVSRAFAYCAQGWRASMLHMVTTVYHNHVYV